MKNVLLKPLQNKVKMTFVIMDTKRTLCPYIYVFKKP
nr:MAG TPA: hypothetical protein [Caudoviricetes sp.]